MKINKISKTRIRQSISGRKKIILLFVLSIFFVAGGFSALAVGEVTPNPSVPGSGMLSPNVTPNPNVPGSGMTDSLANSTQGATTGSSGSLNPLSFTTIEGVLGNIMSYLRGIAGAIAVIFIIIGGVMYMISGGSKEMTERAKKTLICAIAGLAIVLAAPLFYQEIKAILGGGSAGSALKDLLTNILKLLLAIIGFLAIVSMVVGAIWMLTAVGDEERYELGKKTAGYSILGLVIALSALIIANQVTSFFGGGSSSLPSGSFSAPIALNIPNLPAPNSMGGVGVGGVGYYGYGTGTAGVYTNRTPTSGTGVGTGNSGATPGNNTGMGTPTPPNPVAKISPIQPNTKLIRFTTVGETYQLKINFDNSLAGATTTGIIDITSKATYASSNSQIFTVDSNGLVKNTYSYKAGDPNPATATVTISYQGYTSTIAVEAIDQTSCVALNPTDTKTDKNKIPIVFVNKGIADKEFFKKRVEERSRLNTDPVNSTNFSLWRSDVVDKDVCNIAGAFMVYVHGEAGRDNALGKDINLFELADDEKWQDDPKDPGFTKDLYAKILTHELGHAVGDLQDEYEEEGKDPWDYVMESGTRNCFAIENSESAEKKFEKACAYFKDIASSYDCESAKVAMAVGCLYAKDVDKKGYLWFRSIYAGMMGDGMYEDGAEFGIVPKTLINQSKQTILGK